MDNIAINYQTRDDLYNAEVQQGQAAMDAVIRQNQAVITNLSSYVSRCWEAARIAKTSIDLIEAKMMRMRSGEYESEVLNKIQLATTGGSTIFMRLADEKAEAAKAMIEDVILQADEEPFCVKPTPVPDLPPEQKQAISQEVMETAQRQTMSGVVVSMSEVQSRIKQIHADIQYQLQMAAREIEEAIETKIKDVVIESNWREAVRAFISNLVDYKAAFLKGPFFKIKRKIVWGPSGMPEVQPIIQMTFSAPNPGDIYPSPTSRGVNDGYFIEKHTLTRKSLTELKGIEGYDSEAIDLVLKDYGSGGLRRWIYETNQTEVDRLAFRQTLEYDPEGTIDALQFWGSAMGLHLLGHGVDPERIPDVFAEYDVEVWQIGNYVIKCVINEDPLGERPYHKGSFRERNDQFWGTSLHELVEDSQRICNAIGRAIVNNASMGAGPQIGVDSSALPPGAKVTSITPMKVWQFSMKEVTNGARPPIWFFQPQLVVGELMKVYEFYSNEADNKTGIPRYSYGQAGSGGALDTATGFSMMMSNASRGLKRILKTVDSVIEGSIRMVHRHLLLYDPDPILRAGDVTLVAKGSSSLIAKEQQQIRRNEFLKSIAPPEMIMDIIGREGIAEVLRKVAMGLDLGMSEEIVPSKYDLRERDMALRGGQRRLPQDQKTNGAGDRQGGADARVF